MTDLDALAIAVIRHPEDVAAWNSLCDYCEEKGQFYHPRSLILEFGSLTTYSEVPIEAVPMEVMRKTGNLAYHRPGISYGRSHLVGRIAQSWARPLIKQTLREIRVSGERQFPRLVEVNG